MTKNLFDFFDFAVKYPNRKTAAEHKVTEISFSMMSVIYVALWRNLWTMNYKELFMKEFEYTITDPNGIHARPAGLFAAKMQEFTSGITVVSGERTADGKKLLALMKMRVKQHDVLVVKAEGPDEEAVIEAAKDFLQANL
ncbi:MAG: HPr family phosphocarrier protein [Spirochaetaceae bacterium]|jgi:phosphotransferase system HPr (HPr) family protein|nr:HPr family phosphocarrier protein [Spirochaetaceae bacterium]